MYRLERTSYGYRITLSDPLDAGEMIDWFEEIRRLPALEGQPFCVLVDARDLTSYGMDVRKVLLIGQRFFLKNGMKRSAVVARSPEVLELFRITARQSGIAETERLYDATQDPEWEQAALDWLKSGREPSGVKPG